MGCSSSKATPMWCSTFSTSSRSSLRFECCASTTTSRQVPTHPVIDIACSDYRFYTGRNTHKNHMHQARTSPRGNVNDSDVLPFGNVSVSSMMPPQRRKFSSSSNFFRCCSASAIARSFASWSDGVFLIDKLRRTASC